MLMSDLKKNAERAVAEAGAKAAGTLFSALMDRMARKRPNGLVARFRRFFGIRVDIEPIVRDGIDAARKRKRR